MFAYVGSNQNLKDLKAYGGSSKNLKDLKDEIPGRASQVRGGSLVPEYFHRGKVNQLCE